MWLGLNSFLCSPLGKNTLELLKEQRDLFRVAGLKFQEDKMLVSQYNRWSTLLHADQTTLSVMERRASRGYRKRAELNGEQETILMELEGLEMRMEVEAAQHNAVMEELRRRLQALQPDLQTEVQST